MLSPTQATRIGAAIRFVARTIKRANAKQQRQIENRFIDVPMFITSDSLFAIRFSGRLLFRLSYLLVLLDPAKPPITKCIFSSPTYKSTN